MTLKPTYLLFFKKLALLEKEHCSTENLWVVNIFLPLYLRSHNSATFKTLKLPPISNSEQLKIYDRMHKCGFALSAEVVTQQHGSCTSGVFPTEQLSLCTKLPLFTFCAFPPLSGQFISQGKHQAYTPMHEWAEMGSQIPWAYLKQTPRFQNKFRTSLLLSLVSSVACAWPRRAGMCGTTCLGLPRLAAAPLPKKISSIFQLLFPENIGNKQCH